MTGETKKVLPGQPENVEPAGGSHLRTRRVDEAAATRRVEEVASGTLPASGLPLGILAQGAVLCGDCRVVRTLYPHESQHPGLYLCTAPEGDVVVKVAATQHPPRPELWQRLVFLLHPHVLRIFRTCEENGLFFEVQEYCAGGTLDDRVPKVGAGRPRIPAEWIERVFVPAMYEALQYLHRQDIIHRDIKPANIYLKGGSGEETLVLGDFDISAVLEQTRTSRDTQRAAGTWIYTAPEAFPRYVDDQASSRLGRITRKSDYYSLGITIIELLVGTTSLHLCELPDLFDFYLQGGRVELPQGIPGRLGVLLRGLLIRNRHTRWGEDEVNRWLRDENSDDDLARIHDDEQYELARASRPYRLKERYAVDLPGLAEAMAQEAEIAIEDLMTGDVLLNWIGNLDPAIAREIRRDRDRHFTEPELVLHYAIMRCDPTRTFPFSDGSEATTPEEWITHALRVVKRTSSTSEDFCTVPLLQQLDAWLRLKVDPEPEMADEVIAIQQSPPRVRLEELTYLLQQDRPYAIMRGLYAHLPQEIARVTYGDPANWKEKRPIYYEASYQRWYEGALCAWLRQRGLKELATQCDDIRAQLEDEPFAAFETILRLLDPSLPQVEVTMDNSEVALLRSIMYGSNKTFTLRYTTRGCGMPFGAVTLLSPRPGVALSAHIIRQRDGEIAVTIDSKQDIKAAMIFEALLGMESGFTKLVNSPLRIRYRVLFPSERTLLRIVIGAGVGLLVVGIPRFVMSVFLQEPGPISFTGRNLGDLWTEITAGSFPLAHLIAGLMLLLACVYGALRLWILSLCRSET